MKRIMSAAMALLMVFSAFAFVSCADKDNPSVTTEVTNADDNKNTDVTTALPFEKKDYSDFETFTVYMQVKEGTASTYTTEYLDADQETYSNGDVVDSAVYKRNLQVENFYNIKMIFREVHNPSTKVAQVIKDGDVDFQVVYDQRNVIATSAQSGSLYGWNNLNIDYSQPWWDNNALHQLTIKGNCYHMSNDVSVARFTGARFFYFNKQIVENNHLTSPYTYYGKNDWTLDNFLQLVSAVKCESVGTTEMGVYGLVLEEGDTNGIPLHMATGFNIDMTTLDKDGNAVVGFTDQMDRIDTAFTKMRTVFNDSTCVVPQSKLDELDVAGEGKEAAHMYQKGRLLFKTGHFLFTHASISASNLFVDMEDDWGIVPNPKYDKDQEQYAHKVDKFTLMFCLPNDPAQDFNYIADVMNLWAYISDDTVIPAYYDITVKARNVNEETAAGVIDLVKNTVKYDLSDLYSVGITTVIYGAYTTGNISGQWKARQSLVERALKLLNNGFAQ